MGEAASSEVTQVAAATSSPDPEVGLDIVCARIATEKADALDVFYVTDRDGLKLSEEAMRETEAVLTERLSSGNNFKERAG